MVVALQLLCWIGVLVLAPLPEQAAPLWPLPPLLGCSLRCPETLLEHGETSSDNASRCRCRCRNLPAISLTVHSDFIGTGTGGGQALSPSTDLVHLCHDLLPLQGGRGYRHSGLSC
jgi:hypothetical protein